MEGVELSGSNRCRPLEPAEDVESLLAAAPRVNRPAITPATAAPSKKVPGRCLAKWRTSSIRSPGSWSPEEWRPRGPARQHSGQVCSQPRTAARLPHAVQVVAEPAQVVRQSVPLDGRLIVDLSPQLADQITGLRANLRGHLLCLPLRHPSDPASFLGGGAGRLLHRAAVPARRRRRAGIGESDISAARAPSSRPGTSAAPGPVDFVIVASCSRGQDQSIPTQDRPCQGRPQPFCDPHHLPPGDGADGYVPKPFLAMSSNAEGVLMNNLPCRRLLSVAGKRL